MKKIVALLVVFLVVACAKEKQSISRIEGKRITISDSLPADQAIEDYIKPYRDRIKEDMSKVLSYAPIDMHKNDGELETTIGNLMSDFVRSQSEPIFNKRTGKNIDICLLNHGGIRAPIPKGPIKTQTAFNVMPFENSIVVAELTSENVHGLVDYLVTAKRAHPIAGLTIKLDKDYKLLEALVNGKPIEDGKTYHVVTSDYLQNGGDRMNFLKNPVTLEVLDYKIRNAMIDYFKSVDTIPARLDGRFVKQ
ncbi:5'-nucleotidase C-terminal domain-containing protein [Kordia sp. YSTF-M3]|uniref:5'-nucleotidase C-terminal domain-containing protein n=1 Tax=Kordia aestuariivivens TaxID=2759037 RepID=A0ABR7QC59_9FLAO|nr:5'-nucleotidase [Kordia aestuariivivens]MBC8756164.1 5'-nucleotidase C-terminal domain-containing protein [Kordia aestuariivivens]